MGNTLSKVDALAVDAQRSRDMIVAQALQNYLELGAWHIERIEAGIAEADRGEFVSRDEIARIVSGKSLAGENRLDAARLGRPSIGKSLYR